MTFDAFISFFLSHDLKLSIHKCYSRSILHSMLSTHNGRRIYYDICISWRRWLIHCFLYAHRRTILVPITKATSCVPFRQRIVGSSELSYRQGVNRMHSISMEAFRCCGRLRWCIRYDNIDTFHINGHCHWNRFDQFVNCNCFAWTEDKTIPDRIELRFFFSFAGFVRQIHGLVHFVYQHGGITSVTIRVLWWSDYWKCIECYSIFRAKCCHVNNF